MCKMKHFLWTTIWLHLWISHVYAATQLNADKSITFGARLQPLTHKNKDKFKRDIPKKQKVQQIDEGPPNDPSYTFSFRTNEYQRREDADSTGKVRGLYSFIDDIGEKHLVRYAASANRGFEVLNAVPDASRYVRYSAPLYKTSPKARGRIAYEKGPGRQYKFISAGPDQRRTETTGPDGITRGSYSYLDDKGVQRTTQYIAGAGIGYRVVQSTTGPGTHLLPRPSLVEYGILYPPRPHNRVDDDGSPRTDGGFSAGRSSGHDSNRDGIDTNRGAAGTGVGDSDDGFGFRTGGNRGGGGSGGIGDDNNLGDDETSFGLGESDSDGGAFESNDRRGGSGNHRGSSGDRRGSSSDRRGSSGDRHGSGSRDPSNSDRRANWPKRGRESTVITNVGNSFFGIPPGASARAHVQNIDLQPFGEQGALSPAEAFRRDEERIRSLRIFK